ncbi:MAG TPA: ribonuclease PH [bacterium]|nr:ribonuclease PH [bacterium]HQL62217.1 ribonuclease PH [bacterium]
MRPQRESGRKWDELRQVSIRRNYLDFAAGSCLIQMGRTRVLCSASVSDEVPLFLAGSGKGWVTAEYCMMPNSTPSRVSRDHIQGGRSKEIQRLIGRSLRSVTDLSALGERTVTVDCDVIQADGGTHTAAITGGVIALHDAFLTMQRKDVLKVMPLRELVAAISIGLTPEGLLLDLDYSEDHLAAADFNIVMKENGSFVEFQGTAEHGAFDQGQIDQVLALGKQGIRRLFEIQRAALAEVVIERKAPRFE